MMESNMGKLRWGGGSDGEGLGAIVVQAAPSGEPEPMKLQRASPNASVTA
jgi:hypothetical protein